MNDKSLPSAVEWLRRMDAGEISAVELMEQTAKRIAAADQALHAVIAEDPQARQAQARAADERRARGERLPLLGLPVTIKDSIDVAGMVCTGGSFAREHFIPERDATVVARLRDAGAIVVAKTNLPEYSSSYESDNAIFGRSLHPQSPNRTPGGSSGGEGALLGADASIAGVGIDGGGSIRVPSHYCGTVGLRPSVGRVPDTGTWPATRDVGYRDLMCVGPMCRYVEDLALLLPIMSGADWIDPYALPFPLGQHQDVDVKGLRVGYYDYDGLAPVGEQTRAAVKAAVDALAQAGAAVEETDPPDVLEATEMFFYLIASDGGARTRRDLEGANGRHSAEFQGLLDSFTDSTPTSEFFDLQGRFFAIRARVRQFLTQFDVLVTPVTSGPAPLHGCSPNGEPMDEFYNAFNYTHALALGGGPVVVVPAGEQDGLPLGVQIAAQPYKEDVALAAAAAVESTLGGFRLRAKLVD
jgi:amidase